MFIMRLVQENCTIATYEVPIPSKLMCGKSDLGELSFDEYAELFDYVREHAGDYLVFEGFGDREPWEELTLEGQCPKKKCVTCLARVECLVDQDAKESVK